MGYIRDIGESVGRTLVENVGRAMGRAQEQRTLPVDLLESDEDYLAVFDAPGALHSDVQVQYLDGRVEVRIDRFREFREAFEMRYPGRGLALDGSVTLPDDAGVDVEAASARLRDNGTLEVRVPKAAPSDAESPTADATLSPDSDADEWDSGTADDARTTEPEPDSGSGDDE